MSLNILVVEDDFDSRRSIIKALGRSGLKLGSVFEAENGLNGLAVLTRENIDFVLVDLHMPGMDGQEMVKKMRGDRDLEKLPVVFISGEGHDQVIRMIVEKGDGFIQKPFNPETLGKVVVDLISR